MQDNVVTGAGYEGTDEYTPAGADGTVIDKDARRVVVEGSARATIRVSRWNAESKLFTAEMSAPDRLALRLFAYPAWRVEENGRMVQAGVREGTGQMLVPVNAGTNRIQITFIRTWDRWVGGSISIAAWLCVIVWTLLSRKRRNVPLLPQSGKAAR
jgi:hypothetical protein